MAAENLSVFKPDWKEAKERFEAWWQHSSMGRPAMNICGQRSEPLAALVDVPGPKDDADRFLNVSNLINNAKNSYRVNAPVAEAFPQVNMNIGPGSMAIYLGSEPIFHPSTVWFSEVIEDWSEFGELKYDPANAWLKTHLAMFKQGIDLADGELLVNIPDIIENVDILSAMRGPQNFCYDLIDRPELMHDYVKMVDDLYFTYYDAFYDLVKADDGSSSYTAFEIWGSGRTIKVQCDFSALMSPSQFREYVQPSLQQQCAKADHTLYHLDGPDAVKHLDALMEIEELDALQWTPGAGNPRPQDPGWYDIHDKVKDAGKSLWIRIECTTLAEAEEAAERLTKRYGADGLYLLFGGFPCTEAEAKALVNKAETW